MVDSTVGFLLQNLSRLVADEYKLLSGVEDKVISLRNKLEFIDNFLKRSEGKRTNDVVKVMVSQIRDVAFKAEDVVDIYIASITKHRRRNVLSKLFHSKEPIMVLRDVDAEINNINRSIEEIYQNKERFDIGEGEFRSEEVVAAEALHKKRRDVEEEDVVHDSTQVIQQLMERGSRRKAVSIIGMGGLGKTTLARKIYNNNEVKQLFPYRAWGYVSNDFRAKDLLLSLLKCLLSTSEYNDLFKKKEKKKEKDKDEDEDEVIATSEGTLKSKLREWLKGKEKKKEKDEDEDEDEDEDGVIATSEEKLKSKLREWLKGKKYLIVLDDIWKTEVWDEVRGAFPDDKNGSRILITSRINEVARYTGTASPYYLPFLNKDESWELFSKKVFGDESCPPDLECLGRSIVETCGGLPLAIVVIAGLLAKKDKSQREWRRIIPASWHLTKDKTQVMDILKLSYDNLPQRLKPCFLYFGIYPEDYEINARQLIQLWTAEGFIQQPQEATRIWNALELEDIADIYLDELVDRSLVQVASRRSDGGVKTCRIHDLLRDLCISESKSEKFLEVCTEANINTLGNEKPRRLSFQCEAESFISSTNKFDQWCIRSLFFFEEEWRFPVEIMKSLKLCRLINYNAKFDPLFGDLKKLFHLRYLRVETEVEDIPSCISCLCNLETLGVKYRGKASSEIWKLKRLRHLYLRGNSDAKLPILPKADCKGKRNLQTIWLMSNDPQMASLVKKDIFPGLRKLILFSSNCTLVPSLRHLSSLQCLKVGWYPGLPSKINEFPPNLTKLTLYIGIYGEELLKIMKTVGLLTNLQILKLKDKNADSFRLDVGTGEFPQLQVFQMKALDVRWWRLAEGAMSHLRHLVIDNCYNLCGLPEQLWSLTTLRQVHILRPSKELAANLRNVKLKNDCKLFISESEWRTGRS